MSNYDRFSIQAQLQHLQSKYQGTGNASTTKLEWATSIQRDTLASHVGHYSRLAYFAVVENENIKRLRYRFLNQLARAVANPAPPSEDDTGQNHRDAEEAQNGSGDMKGSSKNEGRSA